MAAVEEKQVDKQAGESASKAKYELHYFNGFTGRAEPIMMLLADAGVEYDYVATGIGHIDKENKFSNWARPTLKEGDFLLGQTSAILQYLGRKHGYDMEDAMDQAHVNQVCNNAADMWTDSYLAKMGNSNCGSTSDGGLEFMKTRLDKHLDMVERNLSGSGPYFFDRVTYADFALLNVLRAMRFMYEGFDEKVASYKSIVQFEEAMCKRPNMAKFLENALPVGYPKMKAGYKPEPEKEES